MDINKNSYTFGFAAIMVIVVAALLSFAATGLKPFQDINIELEKKQNILSSVGINVTREDGFVTDFSFLVILGCPIESNSDIFIFSSINILVVNFFPWSAKYSLNSRCFPLLDNILIIFFTASS